MNRHVRLLATVLLGVLLAGCGNSGSGSEQSGDAPAAADADVTFVADDVVYNEAPRTVPAGQVTIGLVNEGSTPHDVAIEEVGDEVIVTAQGGQTATGQAELEPGTYTYYCSIPGHRAAGMEGTFTVEG